MGFWSRLLGIEGGQGSERLAQAESYVESQWTSGLTRHYNAQGVIDSVEQFTGVKLTGEEAVEVVEKVRARHGWGRRDRASYFPPEDEE